VFALLVLCVGIFESKVLYIRNCILIEQNSHRNPFQTASTFWRDRLAENGYAANDFQATLFVGFFHIGSEKLYIDRSGFDSGKAMEIAYQTGLPLINSMLSRTSVSQTLQLAQAVCHSTLHKTYPSFLNEKNILLITNEKDLIPQEKYLISKSKFIYEVGNLKLFSLPVSAYHDTQQVLQDHFREIKQMYYFDTTYQYYAERPIQLFYKDNFDDHASPETFEGGGSYYEEWGGDVLAEIPVNISSLIWIEISYWAKTYVETTAYPNIKLKFLDAQGSIIKEAGVNPKYSADVKGDWVRAAGNFDVPVHCKKLVLQVSKDKLVNFDNLLVRHTAYDVIYDVSGDSSFQFNNYPIRK
jgi:hypothetical protein